MYKNIELFCEVLHEYVEEVGLNAGQIAKKSNLPKDTIATWLRGSVKRPRHAIIIVKVALALHLTEVETDRLLASAKHDSVAQLLQNAEQEGNQKDLLVLNNLLSFQRPRFSQSVNTIKFTAPFQPPMKPSSFVGRGTELQHIQNGIQEKGGIHILQGMGGIGKTTLATYLAYTLREQFPDGVLWADLGDEQVSDGRMLQILGNFIQAYERDAREATDIDTRVQIFREVLANKHVLIILDNAYGTKSVKPLLPPSISNSVTIITTRNKKMLSQVVNRYDIFPLSIHDSQQLLEQFVDPVRIKSELEVAHQLVRFVDGHPLALRIMGNALTEMSTMKLEEYALLLEEQRLDALMDWEDEEHNVRATITLSFHRLPIACQRLFTLLSLFSGKDFNFNAIEAISGISSMEAHAHIGRLRALSLIEEVVEAKKVDQTNQTPDRFYLHALLKLFAREQLGDSMIEGQHRLVAYYVQLINEHRESDYDLFDIEWLNIRGAIQIAQSLQLQQPIQQMVHDLTKINLGVVGYLDTRGYWQDAADLLQQLEQFTDINQNNAEQGLLTFKQAAFASHLGEHDAAEAYITNSLIHFEQASETEEIVNNLHQRWRLVKA